MRRSFIPDLNEITFEGRNKQYGAYLIRKKYRKYLILSFIAAIFIFVILVIIPWLFYYFTPIPDNFNDEMFSVEYSFIPPPEDMPLNLQGTPPPPEPTQTVKPPVVVDSVPEKVPEKKIEETAPQETQDSVKDTGNGPGNSNEGEGGDGKIYTSLDVFPKYPGGDNARLMFLRSNIKYPEAAMKGMIQGVVKIIFVVEADGTLSRFEVAKGIGGGCDEEALRVARLMPRWEPGRRNGQTVRVLISMPVVFRLPRKP